MSASDTESYDSDYSNASFVYDSDDSDDNAVVFPVPNPKIKGRREIKDVKKFSELAANTKLAFYRESARRSRVEAHTRELNRLFPNDRYKEEVILDFDKSTKMPIVAVDPVLRRYLKSHQKEGIRFMWNACCETVGRVQEGMGSGCILAHCMGLGKTLQVVAFVHTVLTNKAVKISKILVLCPKNTLLNWVNEFDKWIQSPLTKLKVFCPSNDKNREIEIMQWSKLGGVLILSYTTFRLIMENQPKTGKRPVYEAMINPGADVIICDEGHILKNEDTKLSRAVMEIKSARRVILTGTPLQNNLIEYYCMMSFVQPFLLGTKAEFRNMFDNPIHNGQYEDSLESDVALMKARSHVLHRTLASCVQRYDYSTLTEFLPEKLEFVISVRLTDDQVTLYSSYLASFSNDLPFTKRYKELFSDYQLLQRVWTHPYSLKLYDERPETKFPKKKKKNYEDGDSDGSGEEEILIRPRKYKAGWWKSLIDPSTTETVEASAKLVVLFEILRECERVGDKVLIFSGSLFSLEMIEHFLISKWKSSWVPGVDYFMLTGATSAFDRDDMCKRFNDPQNSETRLFMISTRAGGLGITLNAANRAIIFDASWNPSHDIQSIFRIYRLGQNKPCFVYRLIASGTMEEKIYLRQVTKQSISHRVLDEKQIARHYTSVELKELYELEPYRSYDNDPAVAAKDPLLKDIVEKFKDLVGGYHEHDSLLQHKADEELNFVDKLDAWSDFSSTHPDLANERAMVQSMTPDMFDVHNFKIVLRKHFEDLPEATICSIADQLMPRVTQIMNQANFQELMFQEALEARERDVLSSAASSASTFGRGSARVMPKPLKVWGSLFGNDFGSPGADDD